MDWSERLEWLILGCIIGFIMGYIVRTLREIKEELDEVDEIVKGEHGIEGKQRGSIHTPTLAGFMLICVVAITAWAAFASQSASNEVKKTQDQLARVTICNKQYLSETIRTINARTRYSQRQAVSNVALQKSQARFLAFLLHKPPPGQAETRRAFEEYAQDLNDFVIASSNQANVVEDNKYPTEAELDACIAGK
jgi:hypothetical protein